MSDARMSPRPRSLHAAAAASKPQWRGSWTTVTNYTYTSGLHPKPSDVVAFLNNQIELPSAERQPRRQWLPALAVEFLLQLENLHYDKLLSGKHRGGEWGIE
jgi:hypothetical protein